MTQRSSIEAASRMPRHPLQCIGAYDVDSERVYFEVSWEDAAADTAFARGLLEEWGVARGSYVLFNVSGAEGPWFRPLMDATHALGAIVCTADSFPFEARRVDTFLRRLPPTAVVGLNTAILGALAELAPVGERLAGVALLARADAHDVLRGHGLEPALWLPLGPALGLECRARRGAHVDPTQWAVRSVGGVVHVSSMPPRHHRVTDAPTGVRGEVVEDPCPCGRAGPRVVLAR